MSDADSPAPLCHACQTPISNSTPPRWRGEPLHRDCAVEAHAAAAIRRGEHT